MPGCCTRVLQPTAQLSHLLHLQKQRKKDKAQQQRERARLAAQHVQHTQAGESEVGQGWVHGHHTYVLVA